MTEQEITDRVDEINAQRPALKEERNRLAWTEGVPAIIAKMKSMGKDTLCLRDGEGFFEYTVSLWGYFENGRGAAKMLRLDENDNLVLVYNYVWNHEEPDDSYWEYGDEDNEVIVNEEISNEIIAPNIETLLNTKFYERYGLPFTLTELKSRNMQSMFAGRPDTIMDLSSVDTSNVTDMSRMFSGCSSLQSLDLSPLNTSKVTNMSGMFFRCTDLQSLDLSPLDTSKVTDMSYMFYNCSSLQSLDLSSLDTSKVKNMEEMFSGCSGLQSLDLSNFVISNETEIAEIFDGCYSLKTVIMKNCSDETVEKIKAELPEGVEIIR